MLAHNLRAAFLVALADESIEGGEEPDEAQSSEEVALKHAAAVERARAGGDRIEELMGG